MSKFVTRRNFIRATLLGLSGALLAACQPQVVEKIVKETVMVEKSVEKAPAKGPKLQYWLDTTFMEPYNLYCSDSATLAALRNNFEVEISMIPQGQQGQKLLPASAAGTLPDISRALPVSLFQAQGKLMDVSDLVKQIGTTGGGMYDNNMTEVTVGGKQYGVPWTNESQNIYYRADLFKAAGFEVPLKSLDEFATACKAVTKPDQKMWGFGSAIALCGDTASTMQPVAWCFGAHVQDKDGNPDCNTPQMAAAGQYLADLYLKHKVIPPGATGWDNTGNNNAYLTGQAAVIYNTGSVLQSMRTKDPGFLKDTVMASFPAGPAGAAELVATSNYGIFTNCKYPKEAGLLIAGTMTPDRYIGALKTGGSYYFPVMKTYASDKFFMDDPYNKQIAESLKVGKSIYADGGPAAWVDEVGTRFLWSEFIIRIVVDGMAPAKSAEKFQADCVETKKKYDAKK